MFVKRYIRLLNDRGGGGGWLQPKKPKTTANSNLGLFFSVFFPVFFGLQPPPPPPDLVSIEIVV